jgi:hypothetical protein
MRFCARSARFGATTGWILENFHASHGAENSKIQMVVGPYPGAIALWWVDLDPPEQVLDRRSGSTTVGIFEPRRAPVSGWR